MLYLTCSLRLLKVEGDFAPVWLGADIVGS